MALGGFNELDFLLHIPVMNNDDNRDTIFNSIRGISYDSQGNIDNTNRTATENTVVFKNKSVTNTSQIKNYYKDAVYGEVLGGSTRGDLSRGISDANPYLKLIRDFNSNAFKAMHLKAADFAYLTDLGVYPLNRLWILRRFSDQTVVPNNLQDWSTDSAAPQPSYTMVGWIKSDADNFLNLSFNETWTVMTERLDQIVFKILEEEFGIQANKVISLPGWSQGLLFGFLKEMGLTSFDATNIPQGNPAVLGEAATRAADSKPGYGNQSTMKMTLSTSYEQKFIGDIDPGSAMLDIIQNCIYMGTRNTEYVMTGSGKILDALINANRSNNLSDWFEFIKEIVDSFVKALTNIINDPKGFVQGGTGKNSEGDDSDDDSDSNADNVAQLNSTSSLFANDAIKVILASTVRKWRYALMGSIALMTGTNSTPWHLTLGNPYSPTVSLGNIKVDDISLKFSNELSFNDMPKRLDVEVQISLGRNLGAQEIFQMFNNGYQRAYTPSGEALGSGPASDSSPVVNQEMKSDYDKYTQTVIPLEDKIVKKVISADGKTATVLYESGKTITVSV